MRYIEIIAEPETERFTESMGNADIKKVRRYANGPILPIRGIFAFLGNTRFSLYLSKPGSEYKLYIIDDGANTKYHSSSFDCSISSPFNLDSIECNDKKYIISCLKEAGLTNNSIRTMKKMLDRQLNKKL